MTAPVVSGVPAVPVDASERDLAHIIERLEQATEGSRKLDGLIFWIVNPGGVWTMTGGPGCRGESGVLWREHPKDSNIWEAPPHFTTSVDAALTLIKGLWFLSCQDGPAYAKYFPAGPDGGFTRSREFEGESDMPGQPALAMCIAALKARAGHAPAQPSALQEPNNRDQPS